MADKRDWAPHDHDPTAIVSAVEEQKEAYAHGVHRPLGSYAAINTAYLAGVALLTVAVRTRRRSPGRVPPGDVVFAAIATGKLSRLIAKDPITSPLRAPFTRFKGRSGEAELAEEVRGTGMQHALGELLTCPFCLGPWVATAFVAGFAMAPRATHLAAVTGTLVAGADVMQYVFAGLQEWWKQYSSKG